MYDKRIRHNNKIGTETVRGCERLTDSAQFRRCRQVDIMNKKNVIIILTFFMLQINCNDNPIVNDDFSLNWTFKTTSKIDISPAIDLTRNTIYVGSEDGCLFAINSNGTEKWRNDLATMGFQSISIANDGTIYTGVGHSIYALNTNGTVRWEVEITGFFNSIAIDTNGTIYAGSSYSNLYAFNQDGTEKWKLELSDYIHEAQSI